jgi:hypothetical protein
MSATHVPLDSRLDRLAAWHQRRNDRSLLGFTLGGYYPLHRYPSGSRRLPEGLVDPSDVVVSDYLEDAERLYDLHQQAGGDLIWSAAPFWGIPWVEAALGCGVVADHTSGSTVSTPPAWRDHPLAVPEFSGNIPWVAKMLEFIPALTELSGGRYPVGVTLMRGISDLLSAIFGADEFVLRMVDEPAEVRAVVERLADFWIALGRRVLEQLPMFHGGTGSFLWGIWSPGKAIWFQEDAAALLSPSLYEQFILPADRSIVRAFDRTVVHVHPTQFNAARHLLDTDVAVIELNVDHDGPRAASMADLLRSILSRKPLLIWGDLLPEDLDFLMTELPHRGLAINAVVASVEEAHAIWDAASRLRNPRGPSRRTSQSDA